MSINIIKKGLSDRIEDLGRYGYQGLGIQPSGPMDYLSAQLANTILDNDLNDPVRCHAAFAVETVAISEGVRGCALASFQVTSTRSPIGVIFAFEAPGVVFLSFFISLNLPFIYE